jgi:hypothetical protein
MSSQEQIDRRMYLAVQCTKMSEELLHQLAEGEDENWQAAAVKELKRRTSPVPLSVHGGRLGVQEE